MEVCLRLMFLTFRSRLGFESLRRELTTSVAAAGLIDAHHPYGGSDAASGTWTCPTNAAWTTGQLAPCCAAVSATHR